MLPVVPKFGAPTLRYLFNQALRDPIATFLNSNEMVVPEKLVAEKCGEHLSAAVRFTFAGVVITRVCNELLSRDCPGLFEGLSKDFTQQTCTLFRARFFCG